MAIAQAYKAKYIFAVYDNQSSEKAPSSELASKDSILTWGKSRFPDLESRSSSGIRVNSYISGLSTPETVSSGILEGEDDCKWHGAKRSGGDSKLYPLFEEGQFQYKNHWYTLASERTIQEAANLSSDVDVLESNFRHKFSRKPTSEFGARATVFKRELDKAPKPYISFKFVNEFTPYAGHSTTIYHKGSYIDWAVVDNTVPECMIDTVQSDGMELVFNRDLTTTLKVGPEYTPASLNDRLAALSDCLPGSGYNIYLTEFFPFKGSSIAFYSYDGTNVTLWTEVNTFDGVGATDKVYIANPSMGEIITNPLLTTFPGEALCEFEAIPLVEHRLPTKEGAYYSAQESSLVRVTTNTDRRSAIYALRDPEGFGNLSIQVKIPDLATSDNTEWANSFYGDSAYKIIFTVTETTTGNVISGVPLKVSKDSGVGVLLGVSSDLTVFTDDNGEVFVYYLPPMLGDSIGIKSVTRGINPKELVLTNGLSGHFFENIPGDVYVYGIYKDDPLMGRIDDPGNFDGTVIWDDVLKNGRKRILYEYNTLAKHPIYNTTGAFAPIRPAYITDNTFVFLNDLPLDEAANDANNLGGFFVAGPRRTEMSVSVDTTAIGIITSSTVKKNFSIVTGLSSFAKGDHVTSNLRYPYGWRLPGNINPSSQLGGALYLTVNPIAGTADILFETAQEYKHFPPVVAFQLEVVNT